MTQQEIKEMQRKMADPEYLLKAVNELSKLILLSEKKEWN